MDDNATSHRTAVFAELLESENVNSQVGLQDPEPTSHTICVGPSRKILSSTWPGSINFSEIEIGVTVELGLNVSIAL